MRKTKEILRLAQESGLSNRQIARSLQISPSTVGQCLKRAETAGLAWPLPPSMDDEALERLLYGEIKTEPSRPLPDMKWVHTELSKKNVTLALIWEEYVRENPEGHYSYSWFCDLYRSWVGKLEPTMRQLHRAGEKLFVDFAGDSLPIVNPETGEITRAHIFVAALGFSSYTYAEAVVSQELPNWIAAHVRAFEFLGGVPEILVPDNLKTGVTHPCRYEPDLNPTYSEMASHYGFAGIPRRVKKPRDKAKGEVAVLQVERWVIAPLRNLLFHSIHEVNLAMKERLSWLNCRKMKVLDASRRELFLKHEAPALKPLPETPYEIATWKKAKVSIDYHIQLEGHYYSVPYRLIGSRVEARMSSSSVEVFHKGKRVASHRRSFKKGGFTTCDHHRPASHRAHLEWKPSRIISWAQETGPATALLVEGIMREKPHPEMGYRAALGIIRLGGKFGSDRLEAAAERALSAEAFSYRSVKSILPSGLDRILEKGLDEPAHIPEHENIRGAGYYN